MGLATKPSPSHQRLIHTHMIRYRPKNWSLHPNLDLIIIRQEWWTTKFCLRLPNLLIYTQFTQFKKSNKIFLQKHSICYVWKGSNKSGGLKTGHSAIYYHKNIGQRTIINASISLAFGILRLKSHHPKPANHEGSVRGGRRISHRRRQRSVGGLIFPSPPPISLNISPKKSYLITQKKKPYYVILGRCICRLGRPFVFVPIHFFFFYLSFFGGITCGKLTHIIKKERNS